MAGLDSFPGLRQDSFTPKKDTKRNLKPFRFLGNFREAGRAGKVIVNSAARSLLCRNNQQLLETGLLVNQSQWLYLSLGHTFSQAYGLRRSLKAEALLGWPDKR